MSLRRPFAVLVLSTLIAACSDTSPPVGPSFTPSLTSLGVGSVTERYTAEVNVYGTTAYTTTWGNRAGVRGNAVKIWDVSGSTPILVDSLIIVGATTLGDVQVVADAKILVVATELSGGSIAIYDLTTPAHPTLITRYSTVNTTNGVHTAEVQRVGGVLYAFLCIDPVGGVPARLTIVDLTTPSAPHEVYSQTMGNPYVHDTYVRDGILFTALWNDGMKIWDIGGAGKGGSPSNPVAIGSVVTVGGQVHNIYWYHDGATGSKQFAFVGEEGPATIGSAASGDVHVVDVSNMAAPREVAFYHVAGAGAHNFTVDETNGVLYAAFYNGGVRALNVRGDLGSCTAAQKAADGRCDLTKMGRDIAHGLQSATPVYIWGVQLVGSFLYASDMLNGLWKLSAQ